jgi:hypothetical protein
VVGVYEMTQGVVKDVEEIVPSTTDEPLLTELPSPHACERSSSGNLKLQQHHGHHCLKLSQNHSLETIRLQRRC